MQHTIFDGKSGQPAKKTHAEKRALQCSFRQHQPLHALNAVLVFVLLQRLFKNNGAAGAVAVLFAAHPLTVEPIPWVGERKTLLAGASVLAAAAAIGGAPAMGGSAFRLLSRLAQ